MDWVYRIALRAAYCVLRVYWFVFRPVSVGASVAVWHRGRLLCITNSYRRDVGLPGGAPKGDEPLPHAAARELSEEVGIEVAPEALRFSELVEVSYEHKRDRVFLFELEVDEEPELRPDRREVVGASFETPEALSRMRLSPIVRRLCERG